MSNHPLIYNKLVRDLIPDKIARSGKFASTGYASDPEFLAALRLKILEEAHELFHADTREGIINESVDILELMGAMLKQYGIEWNEVYASQEVKRAETGGFDKRLMLYATGASRDIAEAGDCRVCLHKIVLGLINFFGKVQITTKHSSTSSV